MATRAQLAACRAECDALKVQIAAAQEALDNPALDADLAALETEKLMLAADLARLTKSPDEAEKLELYAAKVEGREPVLMAEPIMFRARAPTKPVAEPTPEPSKPTRARPDATRAYLAAALAVACVVGVILTLARCG